MPEFTCSIKITVFIAEDHPVVRMGLCESLEKAEDILLVGEAENGIGLHEKILALRPNVLLLDLKMPDFSPAELAAWIRETVPETETLVLTSHDRDAYLTRMMAAGISGYLDKNCKEEQLITAIRRAANKESLFTEEQLQRSFGWQEAVRDKWQSLSEKERQIVEYLCEGKDNKTMAGLMAISIYTVEKHVGNLLRKLEVESRLQAVSWFHENKPTDYDDL
ncbi:MAG: response regulator transcription factor [Anaerolineae bacterium]|nr:response regulator transcription factor [Anaerolineae bacterium]